MFASLGTYSLNNSTIDLILLYLIGAVGYLMRRFDYPVSPAVVGLILGPMAEQQLRRAMQISLGDPLVLVQSPISATLLAIAVFALVAPFVLKGLGRFKKDDE